MNETYQNLSLQNITSRNGHFIIGSLTEDGISFSKNPKLHSVRTIAETEAERLATTNPGKRFIVVQIKGSVILPKPTTLWSV